MSGGRAVLNVPKTGVQLFELYMREPSFRVDKILLTTNEEYIPDAEDTMGPPETLVDTAVESDAAPFEFTLAQNYPNPFNPTTTIEFAIPQRSSVNIEIYSTMGQKVKTLLSETKQKGYHSITWNATDDNGSPVPAGIYYYSIKVDDYQQVRKMVFIK